MNPSQFYSLKISVLYPYYFFAFYYYCKLLPIFDLSGFLLVLICYEQTLNKVYWTSNACRCCLVSALLFVTFSHGKTLQTINLHRLSIQVTKSPRNDQIAMVFLDLLVFFHILTRNLSVDCINLEKSRVSEYIKINYYNFQHVCSSICSTFTFKIPKIDTIQKAFD